MKGMTLQARLIAIGISLLAQSNASFAFAVEPVPSKADSAQELSKIIEKRNLTQGELETAIKFVEKHPSDVDGHLLLARAYELAGMEHLASEELLDAWRLNPKAITPLISAISKIIMEADETAYQKLIAEAMKVYAKNPTELGVLALISQKNHDKKSAAAFLQAALKNNPSDIDALSAYSSMLIEEHKYSAVLDETEKLSKLQLDASKKARVNLLRGLAFFRMNQIHRAIPYLRDSYQADPKQYELCRAYFEALVADKQFDAALEPALMCLALYPPFFNGLDKLKSKIEPIMRLSKSKNINAAIVKVKKNISDGMQLAYFNFALGDLMDRLGNFQAGENFFIAGLNLDPSFGRGYMRLAADMERLGEDEDAIEGLYKKALEADTNDPEIAARYHRFLARKKVAKTDLALKIKTNMRSRVSR